MNTKEIGDLLGLMALVDKRHTGPGDIMAWEEYLPADMTFGDAREALRGIRTRSTDWIMPAHIIGEVDQIRRLRLSRAGTPPMPADLTQPQEREWAKHWCDAVKAGADKDEAAQLASKVMQLPPELPPVSTEAERAAQKARLEAVLDASKRVPRERAS